MLALEGTDGTAHYRLDAGFADAFDLFIPLGEDAIDIAANGGGTTPFLKLAIGAGQAGVPALRIGDPDTTRLDVYETEVGIEVRKQLPEGAYLELFVKVDKDWQRRPIAIQRLGY